MNFTPDAKAMQRFEVKYEKDCGCWKWKAQKGYHGYGMFWYNNRMWVAHRFSYQVRKGVIPEGLEIDHLCRVRDCVNPDHLEAVTRSENIRRSPICGMFGGRGPRNKPGLCIIVGCEKPRKYCVKKGKNYYQQQCNFHSVPKNRPL